MSRYTGYFLPLFQWFIAKGGFQNSAGGTRQPNSKKFAICHLGNE
jgi:hypothetical protein